MFFAAVFLIFATEAQKHFFIDKYILLKGEVTYCLVVVLFLLVVIILGGSYLLKDLNARKDENNRIGKEKSDLQELLLKKELRSSEKED